MDDKKLYLLVGWLAIIGITLIITAIIICSSTLVKVLLIIGFLLLVVASALPFFYEGRE